MRLTNANKGAVILFVNSLMALLVAFGVSLDDSQQFAVEVFVNAAMGLWLGLTFRDSPKRLPQGIKEEDVAMYVLNTEDGQEPFFLESDYDEEGNLKVDE